MKWAKRVSIFLLFAIFCFGFCGLGTAIAREKSRVKQFVSQLNLDQGQREKIRKILENHKKRTKELRQRIRNLWNRLEEELGGGKTESEVREIIEEMNKTYRELIKEKVRYILLLRKVLTPEQFKRWLKMEKKRYKRDWKKGIQG